MARGSARGAVRGGKRGGKREADQDVLREAVCFEGKIGRGYLVFWVVAALWMLGLAVLCTYVVATDPASTGANVAAAIAIAVLVLAGFNAIFAFPVVRSYVEFDRDADGEERVSLAYGPFVDRVPTRTVVLVEKVNGAKGFFTATTISKLRIVARRSSVYIALKDEGGFIEEARRRCPNARFELDPKRW